MHVKIDNNAIKFKSKILNHQFLSSISCVLNIIVTFLQRLIQINLINHSFKG